MSSNPPTDAPATAPSVVPGTPDRQRRPITLRATLIGWIVLIIVVVCAVVGVVTQVFLTDYLIGQKDSQLAAAQTRSAQFEGRGLDRPPPDGRGGSGDTAEGTGGSDGTGMPAEITDAPSPIADSCTTTNVPGPRGNRGRPDFLFTAGQQIGTLGARIDNGAVTTSGILTGPGSCTPVDSTFDATLLAFPTDGLPRNLTVAGLDYRALASRQPDGSTLLTALPLGDVAQTRNRLTGILLTVTGAALVIGAALVFWVVRRSLRPLEGVAATARAVSELPLHRGEVDIPSRVPDQYTDARTEVGQVGAALNQLIGSVSAALTARQASETRVRQFVADASHELRTPLASIRGYAELAGRESVDSDTVRHAVRRVESESRRMSSLVDDLLLLARLDAGRPLADDPVDLTVLAIDAVSDARVAGPDHRWTLDLPAEPVVLHGDSDRLHQVLANLLANARTHTPPGTTVRTALRASAPNAGMVRITVSDDGPGIPEAMRTTIFHRFVRGDGSRSREAGSTGLGLAIVAAVAAAHGGSVRVDTRPGLTEFTVELRTAPTELPA